MFSLSVIIPTFNESKNILKVIYEIEASLHDQDYEIIVVDDNSPDGTSEVVKKYTKVNQKVSCIKRTWKKGLSSAVVEGIALSSKEYMCVMDGDGQHNAKDLDKFISCFKNQDLDLVIGSRFIGKEDSEGLSSRRNTLSKFGIQITNFFLKTSVSDPLSGFFMAKNESLETIKDNLYKDGFKILFDILMLNKSLKFAEVDIEAECKVKVNSMYQRYSI